MLGVSVLALGIEKAAGGVAWRGSGVPALAGEQIGAVQAAVGELPFDPEKAIRRLAVWPLRVAQIRGLFTDAWRHRHNITFADAAYVALAEHLNAPLLTGDHRLADAPTLPVQVLRLLNSCLPSVAEASACVRLRTVADKRCRRSDAGGGRGILAG